MILIFNILVLPLIGATSCLTVGLTVASNAVVFSSVEFDSELATKNSNVVVGGKRFYKGLTDRRMITRLKLSSI